MFVIPLITLRIRIPYNKEMQVFLATSNGYDDYFHLIKVILLYISTILLFIVFIIRWDKQNRFPRIFRVFIPYTLLVFLSMCLSEYKISAILGIFDHYEGGLTQLCYVAILIFSYCFCKGNKEIFAVIKITLWATLIVAVFGTFQFTGNNFLHGGLIGDISQIGAVGFSNTVSSTIGNSNYTGTYAALLFPLSITMMLLEEKKVQKLFAFILFFGSSIFLLLGSMSRAAYIAFLLCLPLLLLLLRRKMWQQSRWILGIFIYSMIILIGMNMVSDGFLWNEINSMNPFTVKEQTTKKLAFEKVSLEQNSVEIATNEWVLVIERAEDGFAFLDDSSHPISTRYDESNQMYLFNDARYENIQAWVQKREPIKWVYVNMKGKDIEFVHTGKNMKVVGFNGVLTDISPVESASLIKNESFASGRGYIWSRAIPLLKKSILVGYGPDTFAYIFPQNDIVGKLNYGAIWAVIGKPHNWYLQIALGSGVLSLLCLLGVFIWYGVRTIGVFARKRGENCTEDCSGSVILSKGIFVSVIAYLITGLFNDSVVSVSPIFWMMVGLGIRLLHPVEESEPFDEEYV